MHSYSEQMEKYGFVSADHESPKRFPVSLSKMFTATGEVVPGYKAIQNDETHEIVHVATDSYTLIPHDTAGAAFRSALESSKLDLAGMIVNRDESHNGCRAFECYVLPAITHNINGSKIAASLGWNNAYDGSMALGSWGGHFSFLCANQAKTGEMIHSRRHVGEIDVDEIALTLIQAVEKYHVKMIAMQTWPSKPVTDVQFVDITERLEGSNKRLQGELLTGWLRAKSDTGPNGGSTLWSAYNVLTNWSTFGDGFRAATKAYTRSNREDRVAALVDSDQWQAIAN